MLAANLAMEYGLACSTGGGTHHAFPGYGSGFCMLNDLAITAKDMINSHILSKVLIVDLDVHQVEQWLFFVLLFFSSFYYFIFLWLTSECLFLAFQLNYSITLGGGSEEMFPVGQTKLTEFKA